MSKIEIGSLFEYAEGKEKKYGNYLATNGAGMYVLELRDAAKTLVAVDKADCEEVMPYTFAVRFADSSQQYHFFGKIEGVVVGSMLIRTDLGPFALCRVTALNTKSRNATKGFTGFLVEGKVITSDSE